MCHQTSDSYTVYTAIYNVSNFTGLSVWQNNSLVVQHRPFPFKKREYWKHSHIQINCYWLSLYFKNICPCQIHHFDQLTHFYPPSSPGSHFLLGTTILGHCTIFFLSTVNHEILNLNSSTHLKCIYITHLLKLQYFYYTQFCIHMVFTAWNAFNFCNKMLFFSYKVTFHSLQYRVTS